MNPNFPPSVIEAIRVIQRELLTMDDADRLDVFIEIQAGYCNYCGSRIDCHVCMCTKGANDV